MSHPDSDRALDLEPCVRGTAPAGLLISAMHPTTELDVPDLYRRHLTMVRACAQRILSDSAAAEDVAQEVFIRFLERRRGEGAERDTAAMLYRMATNLALNGLRNRKRRSELEDGQTGAEPARPPSMDDALALRAALVRVEPGLAEIAACYYLHGMEQEEIAELFAMQRRTVGRRLDAFRVEARALLTDSTAEAKR